MSIPFFLTVDTEGDNIWSKPKNITSLNTEKLYRFQELCEKYNIKPIYLTNYEAAINTKYQEFINKHKKNLEIGLHLHAWNSPPFYNLTGDDFYHQPYLHEYPTEIIKEKIEFMVHLLKNTFHTDIISHRGGRYSINDTIFQSLLNNGIKIDCSVVPGIDWSNSIGVPNGQGGPNFINSNNQIHYIYKDLLEIPISTFKVHPYFNLLQNTNLIKRLIGKIFDYRNDILRSKIDNIENLKKIVHTNLQNNMTHLEYIIHSSELSCCSSPLLSSAEETEQFYKNLEKFFIFLSALNIKSLTFKEYLKRIAN